MDENTVQGMSQMVGILDINSLDITVQAALALQSTLILFFIGGPTLGYFMARAMKDVVNLVLAFCVAAIVILAGNFGLNLVLRELIPETTLSSEMIMVLSLLIVIPAGALLARLMLWALAEPGKPAWAEASENIKEEHLLPFERRRREYMERKKKAQHRY